MNPLQSVAGRMEMTHEDFQRVCQVEITRLVEGQIGDTWLVHLLCEAVRCSRECCELAKSGLSISSTSSEEAKMDTRTVRCSICGRQVHDWVHPDWAHGRICRFCESRHEPREEPTQMSHDSTRPLTPGEKAITLALLLDIKKTVDMAIQMTESDHLRFDHAPTHTELGGIRIGNYQIRKLP